jgi:peptidoglycan hydrolase CwlO-like protein
MYLSFLKKILKSSKVITHTTFDSESSASRFIVNLQNWAIFVAVALLLFFFGSTQYTLAQALTPERRAQLEKDLAQTESEIDQQTVILTDRKNQSVSLQRDIAILDANINRAKLNIKASDTQIEILSDDIYGKEKKIGTLSDKIDREHQSLAQLLRKSEEIRGSSLPEVLLSDKNLSEFLIDVDAFASIQSSLRQSTTIIKGTRSETVDQKTALENKRNEVQDLRKAQQALKVSIVLQEAEKQKILKISKGLETEYKKILASKQQTAAAIRAELFALSGSAAIPFARAYEIAKVVQAQTGIRPAFLLAIIAEESNLGENVGKGNWNVDMPERDKPAFLEITSALGLDPNTVPVSKKPWYGWGGAMGPAQFIPSTWIGMQDAIKKATGKSAVNPWDPGDSFMAAGIYLRNSGGISNERGAALCYLAGCKNANNKAYAFYGNDVTALANKWQKQIDILNK